MRSKSNHSTVTKNNPTYITVIAAVFLIVATIFMVLFIWEPNGVSFFSLQVFATAFFIQTLLINQPCRLDGYFCIFSSWIDRIFQLQKGENTMSTVREVLWMSTGIGLGVWVGGGLLPGFWVIGIFIFGISLICLHLIKNQGEIV